MAKWILQHRSSSIITDMTTYHISHHHTMHLPVGSNLGQTLTSPLYHPTSSHVQSDLCQAVPPHLSVSVPRGYVHDFSPICAIFPQKVVEVVLLWLCFAALAWIIGDTARRLSPQFPEALLHLVCIRRLPGSTQGWAQSMDRRLCLYLDLRLAQRIKEALVIKIKQPSSKTIARFCKNKSKWTLCATTWSSFLPEYSPHGCWTCELAPFSTDRVMATLNEGLSSGGSEVQISRSLQQPSAHHRAPSDLANSSQQAEVKAEK